MLTPYLAGIIAAELDIEIDVIACPLGQFFGMSDWRLASVGLVTDAARPRLDRLGRIQVDPLELDPIETRLGVDPLELENPVDNGYPDPIDDGLGFVE